MLESELHLFVFEGDKTEDKILKSLERHFFGKRFTVKCVYDAEIYQLYKQLVNDDFALDIVNLLKERSAKNNEILKDYNRDSFAFIYLFFDYDAHSTLADDEKMKEMLSFFNNETENGMLYVSYPMVEAIRHYRDMESFKFLTVKCKRSNCPYLSECDERDACLAEPHYKTFVPTDSLPQLSNLNGYDNEVWNELIVAHLCKMNDLVNDEFVIPNQRISQMEVFEKQMEKHILRKCPRVAVLSAFPIFVLDYYGCDNINDKFLYCHCDGREILEKSK